MLQLGTGYRRSRPKRSGISIGVDFTINLPHTKKDGLKKQRSTQEERKEVLVANQGDDYECSKIAMRSKTSLA